MHFLPSSHLPISLTGGKYAPPETGDAIGFTSRHFLGTGTTAKITTLLPSLSSHFDDLNVPHNIYLVQLYLLKKVQSMIQQSHIEQPAIQISARVITRFLPFVFLLMM